MNKSAVLLFAVSAALLGLPAATRAFDDDPLSRSERPWYGGREYRREFTPSDLTPLYYTPSQRYYGRGYTVSYRYLPVYRIQGIPPHSSNFRTEAFHIETNDIPAWGANAPRLTVKGPKSEARPAITTIIRKKSASRTPAKSDGGASLATAPSDPPAITPSPAQVVDTGAPAAIPPPTEAPAKP